MIGDNFKNKVMCECIFSYAVLVLCLVNGSKLSVKHLPHKNMQKEVFNNCGVNIGTSDKQIKDAIYQKTSNRFIDWISV
jgi:hypothetical protein